MKTQIRVRTIKASNGNFSKVMRLTIDDDGRLIQKELMSSSGIWHIVPEGQACPDDCIFLSWDFDWDSLDNKTSYTVIDRAMIGNDVYNPDLIDLFDYKWNLERNEYYGRVSPPILSIPHGTWSDRELQDMKDNRNRAKQILEEVIHGNT